MFDNYTKLEFFNFISLFPQEKTRNLKDINLVYINCVIQTIQCNVTVSVGQCLLFSPLKRRLTQYYCQTPDQTKIKIRSNQKSGEAL